VADYWEEWHSSWMNAFVQIDEACHAFLRERTDWSLVKYRWDNPDRLLSGPVHNGVWGNIHILFVSKASKFRFTYAVWRDEERQVEATVIVTRRLWSTSDDDGRGDRYLSLDEATVTRVKQILDEAWNSLSRLSRKGPLRHDVIDARKIPPSTRF
jgi:hypothetical protein